MASRTRRTRKVETFDFTYNNKSYIIKKEYKAQPATIVLSDGEILHVRLWNLIPVSPVPHQVESFNPQEQDAATLAEQPGAFLAELVK